jgi:quercetin dioxygenase-like cupin family protein
MPVKKYDDIKSSPVEMDGVIGVVKKVPIGVADGWEEYTMRTFTIKPGGHTPRHTHDWEHVNYVIKGKGNLMIDGVDNVISEKDFAIVPPDTEHQYSNPFDEDFEFICIVPNKGEY